MGPTDKPRQQLRDLLVVLIRSVAASVELFLHRRFGVHYVGAYAAPAMLLMTMYSVFWPIDESVPFLLFPVAFFVNCILAQIGVCIRFYRGESEHSRYCGFPRFLRRHLAYREYRVKQFAEPILVGGIGYLACDWNRPLGVYWMFAAVCLYLSTALDRAWQTRQAIVLHDAAIEQHQTAGRFREIHGIRN